LRRGGSGSRSFPIVCDDAAGDVHLELLCSWSRLTRERLRPVHELRPSDVRGEPEIVEAEGLEASHPRVAGIVQTHRQQVDAETGRQQVRTKDIKEWKLPASEAECQVVRASTPSVHPINRPPTPCNCSGYEGCIAQRHVLTAQAKNRRSEESKPGLAERRPAAAVGARQGSGKTNAPRARGAWFSGSL